MIRITTDSGNESRLVIEGHLSGSAVEELRKYCAGRHEPGIILDLSGVVFADRVAAALLRELSAAGFAIEGCSDFIKEMLR
jgi:anti-anti-sigma regulatory factor